MLAALDEAIAHMKQDYPITDSLSGEVVDIRIAGIADTFRVSVAGGEYTLFTDEWHQHFETAEGLEAFLRYLLTGRARVVVTYRGDRPVAHTIEVIQDGKVRTVGGTAELLQPFWRRKRRKALDYRLTG